MKQIVFVTTSPGGSVAKRFIDEFLARGVVCAVYDVEQARVAQLSGKTVFSRIAPEQNESWLNLLKDIDTAQTMCINGYESTRAARDKYRTYQIMSRAKIPTPQTIFYNHQAFDTLKSQLGVPFIVKDINGTAGDGIYLINYQRDLDELPKAEYIAQQYRADSQGMDYRIIVVNGSVVAGMQRIAKEGEYRSNIHKGARAIAHTPSTELSNLAIKTAQAFGLKIAGIDIITTTDGPMVLEANVSPGLYIEQITGINIAGLMCDYVIAA